MRILSEELVVKKITYLLIVAVGLALTGCLEIRPDGPLYFAAPKPPESDQNATIYLIRSGWEQDMVGQAWFYVDDRAVFNSYDRSFSWVQVPPGEHGIKVEPGFWDRPLIDFDPEDEYGKPNLLRLQVKSGETYYIRFERVNGPRQSYWAFSAGIFYQEFYRETLSERLYLEEPEEALGNLNHAVYIESSYKN